MEQDLRDLGSRIEYPPTPDLARSVRHRLDEQEGRRSPGRGFWPSLLSPRWAVPAAALVLISLALLSSAVRAPLSDLLFSGQAASSGGGAASEAGDSAARPESKKSETAAPQSSVAEPAGDKVAQAGATGCPAPALEAEPARAAPGATFRLRGSGFSSGCDEIRPAHDVRISFRQGEKAWKLTTVGADRDLTFGVRLRVPAGARAGAATVSATARPGERAEERFVVLRR